MLEITDLTEYIYDQLAMSLLSDGSIDNFDITIYTSDLGRVDPWARARGSGVLAVAFSRILILSVIPI